jgi:TonB-dependent starch-binding outer membrane protein SusC
MKKKHSGWYYFHLPPLPPKFLRVMKLSVLLTCILSVNMMASVYSQKARFDLDIKDQSVRDILKTIEDESEFRFFYNDEFTDLDKKLTFSLTDKSIDDLMSVVLDKTEVSYKVLDNNFIVITPKSLLQQGTVKGTVTDENGNPMPGVNVQLEGSTIGVISDIKGKYAIDVPNGNAVITFSFIGYTTQKITVGNHSTIDIKLAPDITKLDEVVVVGYGTQKKADITGSVSLVTSKDMEKTAVVDPMQALQGKAAGVNIVSNSGQPGSGYSIQIRGIQSINAGVNPTYVIDGVISDNISNINTNDIESISVLKDGASSSIYGTRAANGIVLITTKRGSANEAPEITFNTYTGIQTASNRKLTLLSSDEWIKLDNESYVNAGQARPYTDADLAKYKDSNGKYRNTDWLGVIMKNGVIKYYDLSVKGGSEKSNYFTSVNYLDQEGRIISQKANKLNIRFNSDHKINKFIEFGNTMNLYANRNSGLPDFYGANASYAPNPYLQAVRKIPLSKAWESDGSYGLYEDQNIEYNWAPPQTLTDLYKREAKSYGIIGNIYVKFNITKDLTFTPRASVTYNNDQSTYFTPIDPLYEQLTTNSISKSTSNLLHWQLDYMLNYKHTFNEVHNLSALLVYSQEEQTSEYLSGARSGTPLNSIQYLSAGDPGTQTNENGFSDWSFISYAGRVNYDYNGKYLLQATVRRDGSSRFAKRNRWGIFPSYSLGWRVSKEDFFAPLSNVINDLKIRASLGTLGNADIGTYPTYSTLDASTYILNGAKVGGYSLGTAVNEDVQWETTKKYNLGIDASLFKSKIYFTADYFISKTTNLLFMKPLPYSSGKNPWAMPYINAGEIQNKGVELELGFREKKGDFSYDVSANFSTSRNKIIDMNGLDQIINEYNPPILNTVASVGNPIFSYFGYKTNGIIKTQADLDAYRKALYATDPTDGSITDVGLGDVWRQDVNGYDTNGKLTGKPDGKIDAADRTIIGRKYPDFTYGFVSNITYKSFSLQIQLQGVSGYDLPINGITLYYFQGNPENSNSVIMNRWDATSNPTGTLPRLTRSDPANNSAFSDIWLSNASYLRINNVNLSYDLPAGICKKVHSSGLRIYCSVQNLYTFTNFKGVEPDVTLGDSYWGGIAADKMPQPRTWIMGLKVSF